MVAGSLKREVSRLDLVVLVVSRCVLAPSTWRTGTESPNAASTGALDSIVVERKPDPVCVGLLSAMWERAQMCAGKSEAV